MSCAIRLDRVNKGYSGTGVLRDFSLTVERGTFLTMIGSSGCGKTTALKLMNGLLSPDSGTVFVEGEDVAHCDQIALRRRIGYVIQGVGLFPHLDVMKNIAYVPDLSRSWDRETTRRRAAELLEMVRLDRGLLHRYPAELSGGQRQRVGLARALAASPKIMLMDEPFGAVDEITRKLLQDEILRIQKELDMTVVFVTHDIGEALRLGTRVAVLDGGRLVQEGTPEEIRSHPATAFVEKLIGLPPS